MAQKPSRRLAREWAVQMLAACDLNPEQDLDSEIASLWEQIASADDTLSVGGKALKQLKLFAEERVKGVITNREEIDGILAPLLEDWELYRLGTVERAVLRMGVWEMKFSDVPPPVIINEAVDLVNWFSGPKSRSIVNGVLDRYAKIAR